MGYVEWLTPFIRVANVRSKLILPAFFLTVALSLACGGGDTSTLSEGEGLSQATTSPPASELMGANAFGEPLGKWADPQAQVKARLTTLGWSVDSCERGQDGGGAYHYCSANKGDQWADVDISDLGDEKSAKWLAEDNPSALRDGKRVLEVTVFDGAAGQAIGELILTPGQKLNSVDINAASKTLEGKGWSIEERSNSSSGGYTSLELIGVQGGDVLVFEIDIADGEKLSRDDRKIDEGMFLVEQGDASFLTVVVLDEAQGTTLLKSLLGN